MRLKHKCSGGGHQRFKFITQDHELRTMPTSYASDPRPVSNPSNELTLTTGALVSALNVIDLRFDLSFFGAFLRQIPARLGTNAALDE